MNIFEEGLRRYLSPEQLSKIQSQQIGIGGAGGLGSNLAVLLTRSGFKHFEIIDQDVIEPSNLNRQYYFADEVGQVKVETLQARLKTINPEIDIRVHRASWTPDIGGRFFKNCDFIENMAFFD